MQPKNKFPTKTGLGALAIGAVLAFGADKAEADTVVAQGGGPYDITLDSFFLGTVDNPSGGAGSYSVAFTSSTDPLPATASASITDKAI